MKIKYKTYQYDGIVIGGGGAGLMAAIRAQENGAKVAVAMKCMLGKAHTVMAEGGMATALLKKDSPEKHFVDTIIWGQGINNWENVWKLVNGGKDALLYLESKGAIFDRNDNGEIVTRIFAGHSEKRGCYVGERVGHALIHTLKNELLRLDVPFFEKTIITKLLVKGNKIYGATGIDILTGEFVLFNTKFVILATGGCGGLYKYTTNSKDVTADGISLAYESGVELMDMEMIQFHSTCMLQPEEKRGTLVSEISTSEGGILINKEGERFILSAHNANETPEYSGKIRHNDLEDSDITARAVEEQYDKGLGPVKLIVCKEAWENEVRRMNISSKFQLLVDKGKLMDRNSVLRNLPITREQFIKFANVDITKEGMSVRTAQHYMMGGLKVNPMNYMTNIEGIFAAGETSAGVHGANRLMGNSLMQTLTEGVEAGRAAANYAKGLDYTKPLENEVTAEFSKLLDLLGSDGLRQSEIREELKLLMWKYAWVRRDEKGLKTALDELEKLKEKAKKIKVSGDRVGNVAWQEALETIGMISTAEAILKSALTRKESRGSHIRSDYPKTDRRWLVNIICRKGTNEMIVEKRDLSRMPENMKSMFPKEWVSKVYG